MSVSVFSKFLNFVSLRGALLRRTCFLKSKKNDIEETSTALVSSILNFKSSEKEQVRSKLLKDCFTSLRSVRNDTQIEKMKVVLLAAMILSVSVNSWADKELSLTQIARLKDCKNILKDVDFSPLQTTIRDLKRSFNPEKEIQIKEVMAKIYLEIVKEQNVVKEDNKIWLYKMIQLNTAGFQLGMTNPSSESNGLNRLIQGKLKKYFKGEWSKETALD